MIAPNSKHQLASRGSMIILTLIFASVFMMLLTSLANYVLTQKKASEFSVDKERALQIAEAGIEYYKWHLAHYPDDLQDGTGAPGPYVHTYEDPETGAVGTYSLQIGGVIQCGKVAVITATSTGSTADNPTYTRTIAAKIARPTAADYSYIVDSNVWAGADRTIIGPYHSNGVIRMDANNQSTVSSKIGTTTCALGGLGGCSGTIKGVYGTGDHPELWRTAVPDINFANFGVNFDELASSSQAWGIYLPKISDDQADGTGVFGYHLVLKNNRTVDIYKVTTVTWITSELPSGNDLSIPELLGAKTYDSNTLSSKQTFIANRAIPASCGLIYASDRVWLDGVVKGKVTVVANDAGLNDPDVFLLNNITYTTNDGSDGLLAIAERHLLIPLYVPNDMTINGIFFAQSGAYGRNYYYGSTYNSINYSAYLLQNSLTTNGTVVSKLRTGTKWGSVQGFDTRYDYYDRNLAKDPPPGAPFTSPNFRYLEWHEAD